MSGEGSVAAKKRIPIEPGLFTIPDDPAEPPKLIGSRCKICGSHFYPKRVMCLRCSKESTEEVLLGPRGKIYSWSVSYMKPPAAVVDAPYGLATIELPEGVHVQAALANVDLKKLDIGMEMETVLFKIKEDAGGNEVMGYMFQPVKG